MVVDAFGHAADDFDFIDRFYAHTEIIFNKVGVDDRSADTHANRTDLQIGFAAHGGNCNGGTSETEQFFFYIRRNFCIIAILNIVSVNAESRKPFLRMSCQHRSQINRARTFRTVETPDRFDGVFVHIHRFCTIAPAGGDGQCDIDSFAAELVGTGGGFADTADGGIGDHDFDRSTVGIAEMFFKEFCRTLCHIHRLFFQ